MVSPTTRDKLACAQRELKMRRDIYPRWVEQGRMSQAKADFEIACMEAILADYQRAIENEQQWER